MTESRPRPLPRPLIVVAVVVAAVGTMWAMWATGFEGPRVSWQQANDAVAQVWGRPALAQASFGGTQAVAGATAIPTIPFAARRQHADRGACTTCHAVVTAQGTPIPAITSAAVMTHAVRGVCTNCHRLTVGGGFGP